MKQVCLLCERSAADQNLYCQDVRCQAELSPFVLDYGELLGDIEIVKVVVVQHTATLYEGQRAGKQIYVKVAHPGAHHTARLEREAVFLRDLLSQRILGTYLPSLLPPKLDTTITQHPYGKIAFGRHLLYYYVFAYVPGEPLRDLLKKTPQLWINHVGRIALGMASAVTVLQSKGLLHLGISPAAVLVHFGPRKQVPQVLLVDLGLLCTAKTVATHWYADFVAPAYTPPELLNAAWDAVSYRSDVYGLGLTLYEMLVGEPAIATRHRSDAEISEAVRQGWFVPMSRGDDVQVIPEIAVAAVKLPRTDSAQTFAQHLAACFKPEPAERQRKRLTLELILVVVVALLVIAFVIALLVSFGSQASTSALGWDWSLWSRYG